MVHPRVHDTVQDRVIASCTKVTSRRRRRLRPLPWSWSDTEDTDPSEVVVPPEVLDAMERDLTMGPESVTQAPSGLLPTWVDEASNPGPGDIRNTRRLRSTQLDCESVEEEAIQVHRARSSADHEGRGVLLEVHREVVSPRPGRRVVLVPGSPDATPQVRPQQVRSFDR